MSEPTADQRAATVLAQFNGSPLGYGITLQGLISEAIRDAEARGRRAGLEEGAKHLDEKHYYGLADALRKLAAGVRRE